MKINMAKHKRLHKITFPRHRKHLHSSSVLKITLETAKHFPQQPIMTQNPPCNTLATVQTSTIERPDPSVTHHYVYQGENSAIFRKKTLYVTKTYLNIAYQSNTMSHEATKLPRSHTKSSIVTFNQTFI